MTDHQDLPHHHTRGMQESCEYTFDFLEAITACQCNMAATKEELEMDNCPCKACYDRRKDDQYRTHG